MTANVIGWAITGAALAWAVVAVWRIVGRIFVGRFDSQLRRRRDWGS